MLSHSVPSALGVSPEDSPSALANVQEFSRTISTPVYLRHYFSVCSAGNQCHRAPPQHAAAPHGPLTVLGGQREPRHAQPDLQRVPGASARASPARPQQPPWPCQVLPWTDGPHGAPRQAPGPALTRGPDLGSPAQPKRVTEEQKAKEGSFVPLKRAGERPRRGAGAEQPGRVCIPAAHLPGPPGRQPRPRRLGGGDSPEPPAG